MSETVRVTADDARRAKVKEFAEFLRVSEGRVVQMYPELKRSNARRQLVYFIGHKLEPGQPVKIGLAEDPQSRLRALQVGYPHRLEIFGVEPGGVPVEREVHQLFAHCRLEGEWFEITTDLLDYIQQVREDMRTCE